MKLFPRIALILLPLTLAAPALALPGFPSGWGPSGQRPLQEYEFGTVSVEGMKGKEAAYIRAKPDAAPEHFGGYLQCIGAANYIGQRIRFSARLRSSNVSGLQLWMRVDAGQEVVGFYNMFDQPIRGTTGWQNEQVVLDVPGNSTRICYGFFIAGGEGEAWADSLSFDTVGRNVPVNSMTPSAPVNLGFDR